MYHGTTSPAFIDLLLGVRFVQVFVILRQSRVTQSSLEFNAAKNDQMTTSFLSSCLYLPSAGIAGMCTLDL